MTKRKRGNNTERRESLRLIHKTVLPITEKSTKDTSKGQKEAWTAKKGDMNIKEF